MKKRTKKRSSGSEQPKDGMLSKGKAVHPGLERDKNGNAIPISKRLAEDRAKARRSSKGKK
jgi:hypothetical protein